MKNRSTLCWVALLLSFHLSGPAKSEDLADGDFVETFQNLDQLEGRRGKAVFWVCSTSGKPSVRCDDLGINELEGPKAELQITFRSRALVHEYGQRHGIQTKECRRMKRLIDRRKNRSFCIRGQFASIEEKNKIGWVFYEYRNQGFRVCEYDECLP
jgi:hypothetical protein